MNEDQEKEVEEVKGRDLSQAEMEKASQPKKTWFFQRGDGMVFACEEREAWDVVYNKSTWKRRDFTLLGTSDGTTYHRIVKESMSKAKALEPLIAEKKAELSKYMRAEEKLIMDEAVDMEGDPSDKTNEENKTKVLRLRGIMDRLHGELDKLEAEHKSVASDIVKRATDAELVVAKENMAKNGPEWPDEDVNIITPDVSPRDRNKILGIMQGRKR